MDRVAALQTMRELDALNEVAMSMRTAGIAVVPEAMARHAKIQRAEADAATARFYALRLPEEFKLGQAGGHSSLRRLFFNHFGLEPLEYSKETGAPVLDAWTLQQYMIHGGEVRAAATEILKVRKATKLLSTYLTALPIQPDGRVHPAWNVWGAITGRWSSAGPNMQNIPGHLRDIFGAAQGNAFLCGDYDKLELRIIAILAHDVPLLDAFASGADVHTANALDIFGALSKDKEEAKKQRNFGKRFVYGANYGATAETIWANLVIDFPDTQLKHIKRLLTRWFEKHAAIKRWHSKVRKEATDTDIVACPAGTRYEQFFGEVEPNKVLNYPIQSLGAHLANRAILEWHDWVQQNTKGRVILQVHDELGGEFPVQEIFAAGKALQTACARPIELAGRSWTFPIESKVGPVWAGMCPLQE